ncbi:MAG TPA: hypothetical protein VET84_00890 [Stellaceae bacterium]|jgi:hypothetical protein|nr:hypothetical protein [Stellaceae bacterium]
MTANRATATHRKDLHELVFIVVLIVLIGVMAWFFSTHSGHGSGSGHAAQQATSGDTKSAR